MTELSVEDIRFTEHGTFDHTKVRRVGLSACLLVLVVAVVKSLIAFINACLQIRRGTLIIRNQLVLCHRHQC